MRDDLFYTGAALNMTSGGDFSNPLLARQGFPSHYYFVYPPLHAYAVFAWLCVWGVSASAMVAFQNLMYFIIAWMMILLLKRQNAPGFILWLVPAGITAVFLKAGLRPEAFSVALSMVGYSMLDKSNKPGFAVWLSMLLLFLGAMAAPRTGFFALTMAAVGAWEHIKKTADKRKEFVRYGILAALAMLVTALIFCVLIRFRLGEFMETFHFHAQRLNESRMGLLRKFMLDLGVRWYVIFAFTALVLCLSIRHLSDRYVRICYWLAATFAVAGLMRALGPGSGWYAIFILLALASRLLKNAGQYKAWMIKTALAALMVMANSSKAIEAFGLLTGKIDSLPPGNLEAIRTLKPDIANPLVVDPASCRYVFDYKLPPGIIDFEFAAPFPGYSATDTPLIPEEKFILGPIIIDMFNRQNVCTNRVEMWSVLGFTNWIYPRHQNQSLMISTGELKIPGSDHPAH
jgi:hypothetical protein